MSMTSLQPIALLLSTSLASPLAAQSVKVNGPLVQLRDGDVSSYLVDPEGERVVYRADQQFHNVFELYSVPLDRSTAPVRLSDAAESGGDVGGNYFMEWELDYAIADGRVVYTADQALLGVFELWSVPIDGSSAAVRLSGEMAAGGDVDAFTIRGQTVFYRADQLANGSFNLFRVPLDGSAPATAIQPAETVGTVWISPDGATAVFSRAVSFAHEWLFGMPTDGSAPPLELAQPGPPADFQILFFDDVTLTADGEHVVYALVNDLDGDSATRLYTVPVDGSSAPVKLNEHVVFGPSIPYALGAGDRVVYWESNALHSIALDGTGRLLLDPPGWRTEFWFPLSSALSADGTSIVLGPVSTSGPFQSSVFRVAVDGSTSTIQLAAPGSYRIGTLAVLGSSTVAYVAVTSENDRRALYVVPLAGGTPPLLLNGPLADGRGANGFVFHPDGQTILFPGEVEANNDVVQLYVVPLDGSLAPRRLNAPITPAGDVRSFAISADGERVVYHADDERDEEYQLHGVPIDTGVPHVTYNPPLEGGPIVGDVASFRPTPDGERVVYRADQDVDGVDDLYSARSDGHGPSVRLTDPLAPADVLADFALTPSGGRTVFQYQDIATRILYGVPTAGGAPPAQLDSAAWGFALPFAFDPAGTRVVYRTAEAFNVHALRSALVDGSAPAITLADPPGTRSVREHQLDAQGDTVVYRADGSVASAIELFSVASDGSAAPVLLNPPLVASGGGVAAFAIAPDSTRVVFRGNVESDTVVELFAVPIDGSSAALKLSGALVAGGDVAELAITADSQRAVFRADLATNGVFELFAVPLDASTAPVRLNGVPVAGGQVMAPFALAGARVFYRADQDTDGTFELYSVPDDASAGPVKLNAPLAVGGDVGSFAPSPDQTRVVYLADQGTDNVVELFSVPADGSGAPISLHPLPSFADAIAFQIAPDSLRVVYLADANADAVVELFSAPLDGSAPPERLNRILPPGRDVETDFAALAGGRALYRADHEANDVVELFCFLGRGRVLPGRVLDGPRSILR